LPGAFFLVEAANLRVRGREGKVAVSGVFADELFAATRAFGSERGRRETQRVDTYPTLTPTCFWYAFSVCGRREERRGMVRGALRRGIPRVAEARMCRSDRFVR
jgi:hypothetical protein